MQRDTHRVNKVQTIRRLPAYLRLLRHVHAEGWETVSGTYLAEQLGLDGVQVRKDLASTGFAGKPRVGFVVAGLIDAIERHLGWNNTTEAVLVGAGSLGTALLGYTGFEPHGLRIVAAFDADETKVGDEVHGRDVFPLSKAANLVRRLHIQLGIITVPAEAAQAVADLLVGAGIRAIWNFTPTALNVPPGIIVQHEDLSSGLAVLSRQLRSCPPTDEPPTA
jgi:redox-sensing transcriptional repressor